MTCQLLKMEIFWCFMKKHQQLKLYMEFYPCFIRNTSFYEVVDLATISLILMPKLSSATTTSPRATSF